MTKLEMLKYLKEIKEKCAKLICYDCPYNEVCDEMGCSPCEMYDNLILLLIAEKEKKNND